MSTVSSIGGAGGINAISGASKRMPPAQKMSNLFDKIDASGSGAITRSQFSRVFQALNPPVAIKKLGADTVFSSLDSSNSGSVTKQNFVSGMAKVVAGIRAKAAST
jgi:Ca2+-binding EF-hand superfamily protein